jgi:ACS family hexuronate transporter-like MFS transporter
VGVRTRHLRWYIGGLLFLSTVINYIDRQTLSVLAPYLKLEFNWTNSDFALVIIAFRVAYSLGQIAAGRFLDRVGTRKGLSLTVVFYSIAAMVTSLAIGLKSFAFFRFLLGAGEAANWPGATKAVSEWFPRRESGWAVALFDSGSSIGAAIAPLLVLGLYHWLGTWRPVFVITGALGFVWLIAFRWLYHPPETHPLITPEERAYILADREAADVLITDESGVMATGAAERVVAAATSSGAEGEAPGLAPTVSYGGLLRLPQTWGIIAGKALSDPVWFFITDWFAVYLVSRGFSLETSLLAFWIPFLAADIGNFLGGGVSSFLIKRGMPVGAARKWVIVVGGVAMSMLGASVMMTSLFPLALCFAVATCGYAALSTMVLNLPADLYRTGSVASVSGMSGAGAGLGTISATYLIGLVSDRYSFEPVLIGASLVPLIGVVAVLVLVRNNDATRQGLVRAI